MIPGLLGALSTGFSLTSLSGCVLLLDSSEIGGLVTGADVGLWSDISGNGHDATQETADNKPHYITGIANGLPIVRFNGTASHIMSIPDLSDLTAATMFLVFKNTGAALGAAVVKFVGATDDSTCLIPWVGDNKIYDNFFSSARHNAIAATVTTDFNVYSVCASSSVWTNRLNGTQLFTTGTNTVSAPATPSIGSNGVVYWTGDLALVGLFNRVLSAPEWTLAEAHLGAKWGVTLAS